jgi:hypothetical protein
VPPAVVKSPPAYRFPALSVASARTVLFMPVPRADQDVPFHFATRLAGAPPAVVKKPPAYRFPALSLASAVTVLFMPVPRADQAVPFHFAT